MATTTEEKEEMVRAKAFPKPPQLAGPDVSLSQGSTHKTITDKEIRQALFGQSIKKAPGPTKLNFRATRLLWGWDQTRLQSVMRHALRLRHHPSNWKLARGVLLHKTGKPKEMVKSYRVISLLECMGKVLEKIVANELSRVCEAENLLWPTQMGARKSRSAIDAVAMLINNVEKIWARKGYMAGAIFMDVNGAFDYVAAKKLTARMAELKIDADIIGWTQSFLRDRRVELVIDGHIHKEVAVETGIPQGSPVSPILFLIYVSGVFEEVQKYLPNVDVSFMDDLSFVVGGRKAEHIARDLEEISKVVIRWGAENAVALI